jgi:hypothetical protein
LTVALVLWALYNWVRFGNPLMTGYSSLLRWDTPVGEGIYGLLFSSGKGLVWFAPLIVLSIAALPVFIRRARAEGWLMVGMVSAFIVLHSVYDSWAGGGGWGPRLIVPVMTWLVLPLGVILERKLRLAWQEMGLAVVIAASVFVQVLGVSVNYARHLQAVYNTSRSSEEYFERVQFHWADSPIAGQVREFLAVMGNVRSAEARDALHTLIESTLAAPGRDDPAYDARAVAMGLLAFNVPDYWFVYAWLLGVPVWVTGAVIVVLFCALAVSVGRLRAIFSSVQSSPAQ